MHFSYTQTHKRIYVHVSDDGMQWNDRNKWKFSVVPTSQYTRTCVSYVSVCVCENYRYLHSWLRTCTYTYTGTHIDFLLLQILYTLKFVCDDSILSLSRHFIQFERVRFFIFMFVIITKTECETYTHKKKINISRIKLSYIHTYDFLYIYM